MTKVFEVCARCGYSQSKHIRIVGGISFHVPALVCPTATWKTEIVKVETKSRKKEIR